MSSLNKESFFINIQNWYSGILAHWIWLFLWWHLQALNRICQRDWLRSHIFWLVEQNRFYVQQPTWLTMLPLVISNSYDRYFRPYDVSSKISRVIEPTSRRKSSGTFSMRQLRSSKNFAISARPRARSTLTRARGVSRIAASRRCSCARRSRRRRWRRRYPQQTTKQSTWQSSTFCC